MSKNNCITIEYPGKGPGELWSEQQSAFKVQRETWQCQESAGISIALWSAGEKKEPTSHRDPLGQRMYFWNIKTEAKSLFKVILPSER